MAKRIMWDFCNINPTVQLLKADNDTVNYLQKLYIHCKRTPLLIIAELGSSRFSISTINDLRVQMGRSGVRALFICVSRATENHLRSEQVFTLPDTPDMNMGTDEAINFLTRYKRNLNPVDDCDRIEELEALTYIDTYDKELRQPFFYGLFAYGENYTRIDDYVRSNLNESDNKLHELLTILSLNTKFTQDVNLSLREVAHLLYPHKVADRALLIQTRELLSQNCFIIKRNSGYRISHPIIADKLLKILLGNGNPEYQLLNLAKKFVNKLALLYTDPESPRLNEILQSLFVDREPITDEERSSFSPLISQFQDYSNRLDMMRYLRDRFQTNPHYSNHLARLYLKPQNQSVKPDITAAKEFALEAISRAENNPNESPAIHNHLLGKVYSRKCLFDLRSALNKRKSIPIALATDSVKQAYQHAINQYNICGARGNKDYGLVGKLELIAAILMIIVERKSPNIPSLISHQPSEQAVLPSMIAEAGDIIHQFLLNNDDPSQAFRTAQVKFYQSTGKIHNIQKIINSPSVPNSQQLNYRRAIVSILEHTISEANSTINYDLLSLDTLRRITSLLETNINTATTPNDSDRFRWLYAYQRLPEFDLKRAYDFVTQWPNADKKLDVVYYR